ncbi:hypothetical protein RND71_025557 [Anisodus tanguticus]|uniref:Uncharacterized protein n=1 Tax=Anisodus tanguticus TaxID=243964 RepID=A0AAE1RT65_9SOLA|nr:hypothetical protein RND71_025557 [Anisodus tanguticus]
MGVMDLEVRVALAIKKLARKQVRQASDNTSKLTHVRSNFRFIGGIRVVRGGLPDAAERRTGSRFPTGRGTGDGHLKAHHDLHATPARPGKATRLGVRGSIVPAILRHMLSQNRSCYDAPFLRESLFWDRQDILVWENWLKRGMNAPPSVVIALGSYNSSLLTIRKCFVALRA